MKYTFKYITALISLFSNIILLFLIFKKSPRKLGSYKYLMLFSTFHSMFLSTMEILARVNVLSFGTSFVIFIDRRDSIFPFKVDMIILCIDCACCGTTMYTSVIHFIFRYWAIERKGRLSRFKDYRMIFWISIPIFMGALWIFAIYFGFYVDQTALEYISPSLMSSYEIDSKDVALVGVYYYSPNKPNFYRNLGGLFVITFTMTIAVIIIIYYGVRIFRKIRKIYKKGGARGTKRLQAQLYKALVVQTILPLLLIILPVGVLVYFPLIHIDIGIYSQITNVTVAIYPIFEPLPSLILIDDYRIGFMNMMKLKAIRGNQIQPERQTISISYELQRRFEESRI